MYCTYCGSQLDSQAKFCPSCGKNVNENPSIVSKIVLANALSVVLILFSFYGIFADAIGITDEGELSPLSFVILLLLAGCAIALYKTRVYLINIICFGVLSIIYLVRIINLQEVLAEEYGRYIDFDSFEVLYWMYFITLSVIFAILAIKYNHENKSKNLMQKISSLRNRLKDAKAITSDEMISIVLSGMNKKSILIIGLVSCSFWIYLTHINSIQHQSINIYFILSLISKVCIGFFLYAIYSHIAWKRPFMRLSQCFDIILFAFIIGLGLDIRALSIWNYAEFFAVLLLIKIVVGIVLCFNLYKICCGFKGKQNTAQLEISMMVSMFFLCVMLVLDLFADYLFYYYSNDGYYYGSPFGQIRDYWEDILQQSMKSKVTMIAPIILSIVLVLLFRNMLRSLKTLANNKQVNEESLKENSMIL